MVSLGCGSSCNDPDDMCVCGWKFDGKGSRLQVALEKFNCSIPTEIEHEIRST